MGSYERSWIMPLRPPPPSPPPLPLLRQCLAVSFVCLVPCVVWVMHSNGLAAGVLMDVCMDGTTTNNTQGVHNALCEVEFRDIPEGLGGSVAQNAAVCVREHLFPMAVCAVAMAHRPSRTTMSCVSFLFIWCPETLVAKHVERRPCPLPPSPCPSPCTDRCCVGLGVTAPSRAACCAQGARTVTRLGWPGPHVAAPARLATPVDQAP